MTEFFSVRGRSPLIRLYIRTESGAGGGGGVGGGRGGGGGGVDRLGCITTGHKAAPKTSQRQWYILFT